jgi:hypothetical protein
MNACCGRDKQHHARARVYNNSVAIFVSDIYIDIIHIYILLTNNIVSSLTLFFFFRRLCLFVTLFFQPTIYIYTNLYVLRAVRFLAFTQIYTIQVDTLRKSRALYYIQHHSKFNTNSQTQPLVSCSYSYMYVAGSVTHRPPS